MGSGFGVRPKGTHNIEVLWKIVPMRLRCQY
jgi:hypothetical protein